MSSHFYSHSLAAVIGGVLVLGTLGLTPAVASEGVTSPGVSIAGKSEDEKAAEKAAKEAEKAAKDAAKQAEKAAKEAEKAVEQAAKEAEKAAKEAEKAAEKASKDATKDAGKQAAAGVSAAARAEAAAAAVQLIAEYTDDDIKDEIRLAQRETRETFKDLKKETQKQFAAAKKEARSAYKAALAAADEADSKAERQRLRAQARAAYAEAKKRNRSGYLSGLEDARRYNGRAQIVFFDPGVTELGEYDDPVAVAAVATSGLPVVISSITPETCSVADGFVTPEGPGSCVLAAEQDGNDTYAPASAEATIEILDQPDPQTITFAALPALQVAGAAQALTATASSGLAVAFVSQTPQVCAVDGATVTPISAGTCTVQAAQLGNDDWQAAEPVQLSTVVAPAADASEPLE